MTCIVFDIDGTVANGDHRRHFVMNKPKNWPAYQKAAHLDVRIDPTWLLYHSLKNQHTLIFVSGRSEDEREVTQNWLIENDFIDYHDLFMRPSKDYRRDDIIKEEILDGKIIPKYGKPLFAIDDRKRVKEMWVRRGIFVFDVNQTDEVF